MAKMTDIFYQNDCCMTKITDFSTKMTVIPNLLIFYTKMTVILDLNDHFMPKITDIFDKNDRFT